MASLTEQVEVEFTKNPIPAFEVFVFARPFFHVLVLAKDLVSVVVFITKFPLKYRPAGHERIRHPVTVLPMP